MKRLAVILLLCAVPVVLAAASARAFHHHGQFQEFADGRAMIPGSGGLYYTGSRRDLGLRCSHCHIQAPGRIRAAVDFSPALSGGDRYVPGTTYTVTVTMTGETQGLSMCPVEGSGPTPNRNSMAAMLTGPGGNPVGRLSPDEGGRQCGSRFVNPPESQTTVVFGDCDGVTGSQGGARSLSRWVFRWEAPARGTGEVTLWLGVVDGNCRFDSYDDDVFETSLMLTEG